MFDRDHYHRTRNLSDPVSSTGNVTLDIGYSSLIYIDHCCCLGVWVIGQHVTTKDSEDRYIYRAHNVLDIGTSSLKVLNMDNSLSY